MFFSTDTGAGKAYESFRTIVNSDPLLKSINSEATPLRLKLEEILQRFSNRKRELALETGVVVLDEETLRRNFPEMIITKKTFGDCRKMDYFEVRERSSGFPSAIFYSCENCGGLVRGEPLNSLYDDLGPLSGSAGETYSCRNCGTQLTRIANVHS